MPGKGHFFLYLKIIAITVLGTNCFVGSNVFSQTTYAMQNAFVEECEGILTDSDDGPEEGQYDHNENYTFTVCVDNASEIIISFHFFTTEETYDILTLYDGPNTASPVLATLTGSLQPPPVFVATSGCVTFHFISDDNIVAAGWELEWNVEIEDPTPPSLSVMSMLDCPMQSITFQFDYPVGCDMFSPDHFTILGPGNPSIAQVVPLDCMSGQTGQVFEVIFSEELSRSGTYRLLFNGAIQDACGEWHDVSTNIAFNLTNCPFNVEIHLEEAACAGDCGSVYAEVIGEPGVVYQFMWAHTPVNQSEVDICTDIPVSISVTVTDPVSLVTATAQYNYIPLPNPVIINPVQDTVCSSMGDHIYQSNMPGGYYTSSVIPDHLQMEGRYQFWRWNNSNNLNIDIVTYEAPNGCLAHDTVYVLPVNAGSIEAACLNASDFTVGGGSPAGGIWQGPHITSGGVFSPVQVGSFVVNYTAPNGCIGYKRINVTDNLVMPDVDTLCSTQEFDLVAVPNGGRWSGPGIVNPIVGRLRAWTVTPNQTYQYVYTLQGCSDTISIYIQQLWAGPDVALCDADSLLQLTQAGSWSGPGIYLPAQNAFDISMLSPGEYRYTLSAFGCSDDFSLYIIDPHVDVYEPVNLCQVDEWIPLYDLVDYDPDWGAFSGTTIIENNDEWYFNPGLAGSGIHTIVFEAVGCRDSFSINVEPFAQIPEYSFCELSTPEILAATPPGGTWSGPGFLDGQIGLFDPQLLSAGSYPVSYTTPLGCITEDTIDIILWEQVRIQGVSQQYCFTDTVMHVDLQPSGGTFLIDGIPSVPEFNPAILGAGTHELFYSRGTGPCASEKRLFITILFPITGAITQGDSICIGENAVVEVDASGGSGSLTPVWDQGLGFGSSHIVNPSQSTTYTVTITDGCSDPLISNTTIYVHQPFEIDVMTGPPVCYDQISYVSIEPPVADQYAVYWHLDSLFEGTYIEGPPGIYQAEVIELSSGCSQEYEVVIPGPPALSANFTIVPNQPCIDIIDNTVEIIDLSTGYTNAWIDFGDGGQQMVLAAGELIQHEYQAIGAYLISLFVENDLGCADTFTREICVENVVRVFIPNIFSPNGDGVNDLFKMDAFGTGEFNWSVFSRWGDLIFETNAPDDHWDGTLDGRKMSPGVYVVKLSYTDLVTGEQFEEIKSVTLVR